jgi:hypothetical protein
VGSATDDGDSGFLNGSRFVLGSQGGSVVSMSVYVAGPVDSAPRNQYQLAIYTDQSGKPGTLLAHSGSGTLTANAWNTLAVSASLQPNTAYWLMYATNGGSVPVNNLRYSAGSSGQGAYSGAVSFGSWPQSFGPATLGSWKFSIYATYTPQ